MIGPALLELLINGREPEPQGNFSATAAPHGCYRCKGDDRWCVDRDRKSGRMDTFL